MRFLARIPSRIAGLFARIPLLIIGLAVLCAVAAAYGVLTAQLINENHHITRVEKRVVTVEQKVTTIQHVIKGRPGRPGTSLRGPQGPPGPRGPRGNPGHTIIRTRVITRTITVTLPAVTLPTHTITHTVTHTITIHGPGRTTTITTTTTPHGRRCKHPPCHP
jgi:hypothetical protein